MLRDYLPVLLQIIVAANCLMQRGEAPVCHSIGIGAGFKQHAHAVGVVPIGFAQQHCCEVVSVHFFAVEDHF